MIQLIKKEAGIFYINIHGIECVFIPMCLFTNKQLLPIKPKVKGSTLHWYVNRKYISYNQIKKAIKNDL